MNFFPSHEMAFEMKNKKQSVLNIVALNMLFAFSIGCTGGDTGGDVIAPVDKKNCEKHSECGEGFTCEGGVCRPGECVQALQSECGPDADPVEVAPFCCQPWQVCNFARECVADPDAPIGTQCLVSEDCPGVGQFCSGGTCYDPAGRTPCTASFQCPPDERCDRTVFLCVPDLGGCTYCDVFPELCCEEGSICDAETGFCSNTTTEIECTPETVEEDCLPNQQCDDLGRCVQCISDDDCGPGTACNPATGSCYSILNRCETDEDCDPPRLCSSASNECVVPQCETSSDCDDVREQCDETTYTCYLPPAECNETDEPNDNSGQATPMTGLTGAGTLCRGNTDYLSFSVNPDKRYRATVSFPDFNVGGITFAILDSDGVIVDNDVLATFDNNSTVTAITGEEESGTFFLRLVGSGDDADLWAYSIEIEETDAPELIDCSEEEAQGIEPNDSFGQAYTIAEGATSFSRCDSTDDDYYHFVVPAQHTVDITVDFENSEGDLAIALYSAQSSSSSIDSSDGASSNVESVEAPEGYTELWLKVNLWSPTASSTDGQVYTVTLDFEPRPEQCNTDTDEPENDSPEGAATFVVNTSTESMICVAADIDYHHFIVPADSAGELVLDFDHGDGDLRLDLYDDQDMLVDSSNSSTTANPSESIELPFASEPKEYIAVVRLNTGSGTVAQQYTLMANTYDASACTLSEPEENNTFLAGQCVGNLQTNFDCLGPTHESPLIPPSLETCEESTAFESGCGTVCGANDHDWYRVGTLNDGQLLRAKLTYDPGDGGVNGRLGLALARANDSLTTSSYVEYEPNTANNGTVELSFNAPTVDPVEAREYGVLVRPEGTLGFSALSYSLEIEVGEGCYADDYEPNSTPLEISASDRLRPNGVPGDNYAEVVSASLCAFDHDIYELFAFPGETLNIAMLANEGVNLAIGTRPDDLSDQPLQLDGGMAEPEYVDCPAWWTPPGENGTADAGSDAGSGESNPSDDGGSTDPLVDGGLTSDAGVVDGGATSDGGAQEADGGPHEDGGSADAGVEQDAGSADAGTQNGMDNDSGVVDGDGGSTDTGSTDAGSGSTDAGSTDAGHLVDGGDHIDGGQSPSDAGEDADGGSAPPQCYVASFENTSTQQLYITVSSDDSSSKGLYQLHVTIE